LLCAEGGLGAKPTVIAERRGAVIKEGGSYRKEKEKNDVEGG